ncbi:Beta-glucosidase BoGH3B [Linum perenne]
MASSSFVILLLIINFVASTADRDPNTATGSYLKYKDPNQPTKARIQDLMSRMTLAEKIGQMVQIDRFVATEDAIRKYFIGSVISVSSSVPDITPLDKQPHNNISVGRWVYTINKLQNAAVSTPLGIPMLYGLDVVHGQNYAYGATIFPHNVGLGVTRDPELAKRIGAATAIEARATGVRYVFSPTVAVCRDPRWGRCYESFSEDPTIVRQMTEIVTGLQGDIPANSMHGVPFVAQDKTKVVACAKHYVGDGGTVNGIDRNNTVIPWEGLVKIHMLPFLDAIYKGVASIMISYSSWNGKKMHANRDLIASFLKDKLHFRGFVISDWQGIDKITIPEHANYSYSIETALKAGIDMVMVPYEFREFIKDLTYQVEKDIIPISRIDDAVSRILRVKFTMGLFETPLSDLTMARELGKKEHRELAREAVRKSLVLLKNGKPGDRPMLPLHKKASSKILVAGSHAHNLGLQCGGWTIEWQGEPFNNLTLGKLCGTMGSPISPIEVGHEAANPSLWPTPILFHPFSTLLSLSTVPLCLSLFLFYYSFHLNKISIIPSRSLIFSSADFFWFGASSLHLRVCHFTKHDGLQAFMGELCHRPIFDIRGEKAEEELLMGSAYAATNGGEGGIPSSSSGGVATRLRSISILSPSYFLKLQVIYDGFCLLLQSPKLWGRGVPSEQNKLKNDIETGTTILDAIKSSVDRSSTEFIVHNENPTQDFVQSNNFSYGIVVVGEGTYAEYEGDSSNLTIPHSGLTTIDNVCGAMRCVVILITGRPMVIQPWLPKIDALVAAWLPGTEGQGVADVLFGDYGFTGKLARTWFKSVDQLPMNVGDSHYDPLFPFGFGLTTQPTSLAK